MGLRPEASVATKVPGRCDRIIAIAQETKKTVEVGSTANDVFGVSLSFYRVNMLCRCRDESTAETSASRLSNPRGVEWT